MLEGGTAAALAGRLDLHAQLRDVYERRETELIAELEAERAAHAALRDDCNEFAGLFGSAVRRHVRGVVDAVKRDKARLSGPLAPRANGLPERVTEADREAWRQAYMVDPDLVRDVLGGTQDWSAAA